MEAAELIEAYGSPLYVYDLAEVRAAHRALTKALPHGSEIYYSLKANPNLAVVHTLVSEGCKTEVSSPGELGVALAAGAAPVDVLYTGPGKTAGEIAHALAAGVVQFSIESPTDLGRIAAIADRENQTVEAILRINPMATAHCASLTMGGEATQFGMDGEWLRELEFELSGTAVDVCGLHVYLGSGVMRSDLLIEVFAVALAGIVEGLQALSVQPKLLNLGGGFGNPYARSGERIDFSPIQVPLKRMVEASLSKLGHGASPRIAFESGRYLTGSCGRLLCTVQDVKYSRGERHVVLDAGINHLGGMQGLRRLGSAQIEVLLIDHIGEQSKEEYADITHVVGPLCTPLDRWACLPGLAKLKPGDLVEVRNVGAYGLSASLLAFLSRDTPCEVVIDNEAVVAATRLSISSEHVLPRRLLAGYAPPKTG